MKNYELFKRLEAGYAEAYPASTKQDVQKETVKLWNDMKKSKDGSTQELVTRKLEEYKQISMARKGSLMTFWSKVSSFIFPKDFYPFIQSTKNPITPDFYWLFDTIYVTHLYKIMPL